MLKTVNNLSEMVELLDGFLGTDPGSGRIFGGCVQGLLGKTITTLAELGESYTPSEAVEDVAAYNENRQWL